MRTCRSILNGSIADGDRLNLGTLADGTVVTVDYDNKTISYGTTALSADTDPAVAAFFAEADGTSITIGSTSTGGAGFAIQDPQLFASPTPVLVANRIILDLGGEGIDLSYAAAFDINADGQLDNVAWTDGQDGMLVMDRDGSGTIENGTGGLLTIFQSRGIHQRAARRSLALTATAMA